jgi:hypothetical protein
MAVWWAAGRAGRADWVVRAPAGARRRVRRTGARLRAAGRPLKLRLTSRGAARGIRTRHDSRNGSEHLLVQPPWCRSGLPAEFRSDPPFGVSARAALVALHLLSRGGCNQGWLPDPAPRADRLEIMDARVAEASAGSGKSSSTAKAGGKIRGCLRRGRATHQAASANDASSRP